MAQNAVNITELINLSTNDADFATKCKSLATEIAFEQRDLLQLVTELKPLLVNDLPDKRQSGTLILSNVIACLPDDCLTGEQLGFIASFYADRLNDNYQVIPAVLKGLLPVFKSRNLPNDAIKIILTSLFQNVHCQQQLQHERHQIYEIFHTLLQYRLADVLKLEFEFIYGVISSIDGERDPRNLLFLFDMLPLMVRGVNLGHLIEEMFEVIACYFPIDFRAPTDNNITRDSLATGLCNCLTAIAGFGEFCLPLAIEKLDSTLHIAKIDSLHLLAKGCDNFDAAILLKHFPEIWPLIQRETYSKTINNDMRTLALTTLTKIVEKITNHEAFAAKLLDAIDSLKGNLLPDSQFFSPTAQLLIAMGKGSLAAYYRLLHEIIPLLINTYRLTTNIDQQTQLLSAICDLAPIASELRAQDTPPELLLIVHLCVEEMLSAEERMRIAALENLPKISRFLSDDRRHVVYATLAECLLNSRVDRIQAGVVECMKTLTIEYQDEIVVFCKNLRPTEQSLCDYLNCLCEIAPFCRYAEIVAILIDCCVQDMRTSMIAFKYMRKLILNNANNGIRQYLINECDFVVKTIEWCAKNVDSICLIDHREFLIAIADLLQALIETQMENEQKMIVFPSLKIVRSLYGRNAALIVIIYGLLTRLRPNLLIDCERIDDLFVGTLNEEGFIREISCQLMCNVLNKYPEGDQLIVYLNAMEERCDNASEYKLTNRIWAISWVTKALITRDHRLGYYWTNKLLNLLETSPEAALGFKLIMDDDYDCLCAKNMPNKSLLYRQKFFTQYSSILNGHLENRNCLLAISNLIEKTPTSVLTLNFDKVFRAIILCMDQCEDGELLYAILQLIRTLIEQNQSVIEEKMQEFLPRLLSLSSFQSSMKVRICALQCLYYYPSNYAVYKLLPHKQEVLKKLMRCLDDTKRLVRKEAVKTRLKWCMLDAPV